MSKLVELLLNKKPTDSKANTKGVDKTPIGVEQPFQNSKDLMNSDLSKFRGGVIGGTTGGYNSSKKYTDTIQTSKTK